MKMILTVGLPGSGKTTYALDYVRNNPGTVNVNRDDIRFSQYGVYYGPPVDEDFVTSVHHGMINAAFKRRHDVIVSDTNLNRRSVKALVALATRWGAAVEFVYFDVPMDELIKRDELRAVKPVGQKVLRDFAKRFNIPADGALPRFDDLASMGIPDMQPYVPFAGIPPAILVDLDGTIALHDRSPYDYDLCYTDRPNKPIIDLIKSEYDSGTIIVFASGRPDSHRHMTAEWIYKHTGINVDWDTYGTRLLMRTAGDKRMDAIVKYELFEKYIRNYFNVKYCLDDRDQVVDMYRAIDLTVLQVNYGAF